MYQLITHSAERKWRLRIPTHSGWMEIDLVFQLVCRRATVSVNGPWGADTPRTRLVFIARRGSVNMAAAPDALNGCQAPTDKQLV
jgi:hypothetical protein